MSEIRVLVLGNKTLAKRLDTELDNENIEHVIDQDIDIERQYDLSICHPDADVLDLIKEHCGNRIVVFNGHHVAESTLKNLIKMRIIGFLDDHDNPEPVMRILRSLAQTKEKMNRISSKISTLMCAGAADRVGA